MSEQQDHVCAICGLSPSGLKSRLCVDHCHETSVVRGLLCDACNVGLGRFSDNTVLIKKALLYLESGYVAK